MSRPSDFWYKAKRGKKLRRRIYRGLRARGVPPTLARRIRDWSGGHISLFLKSNGFPAVEPEEVEDMPVYHYVVYFGALKTEGIAPTRELAERDAQEVAEKYKQEYKHSQFIPVINIWEEE